jgi:hypothetical protein
MEAYRKTGGYASDAPSTLAGDRDMLIRLVSLGLPGVGLHEIGLQRQPPSGDASAAGREAARGLRYLLRKHRVLYDASIEEVFPRKDTLRLRLEAHRYPLPQP